MSRPRFLADHDLNEHIVHGVLRREPAIEFLRVRDVALHEHSDAEVLAYAATHQLLVISHDVNTMPAAAYARIETGSPVAGVLMVKQSEPVGRVIDDLILLWSTSEAEEWQNAVAFLPLS
jgi:predicted nuclease of predicted toxin-antitoxin system